MSENAFTRMQAIAAVLIKKEAIGDNSTFIILDTDTLTACSVQNFTEGQFNITGEWSSPPQKDFYTLAAEHFFGTPDKAADIFELCADASSQLTQFLKQRLSEAKNAVLDEDAGITCRSLLELYKEGYEDAIKKATAEAVKENPSVNVHPIGRFAAFYPALHSIKEMLCTMPFSPAIPFYVENKEYFCDTVAFEAMGRAILTETDQKRRSVKDNIFFILKKLTADGISDEYRLMASSAAAFTAFSDPSYCEPFFAHRGSPLRLLSGGNSYNVEIPAEIFPANTDTGVISVALLYDGEKLMLSFKSSQGTVSTQLDEKIYS